MIDRWKTQKQESSKDFRERDGGGDLHQRRGRGKKSIYLSPEGRRGDRVYKKASKKGSEG